MAIALALARITVACPHCFLTQFQTSSGDCRRCHLDMSDPQAGMPVPEPPKVQRCTFRNVEAGRGGWIDAVLPIAVWHLRESRGFSQRELAKVIGVPRTFMSKMENGRAAPNINSMYRLALALDVHPSHLMLFCEEIWQACEPVKKGEDDAGTGSEGFPLLRDAGVQVQTPEAGDSIAAVS